MVTEADVIAVIRTLEELIYKHGALQRVIERMTQESEQFTDLREAHRASLELYNRQAKISLLAVLEQAVKTNKLIREGLHEGIDIF